MTKYVFLASYTAEGAKGVQSSGGSSRVDALGKVAETLGGTLESFYFGRTDAAAKRSVGYQAPGS